MERDCTFLHPAVKIDCFLLWIQLWLNQNSGALPEANNNTRFSSCLAKTPAGTPEACDGWGPRFWMFSPLRSGVTGIFDPLLFASTLIFISGEERSLAIMRKHSFCLWQLRLNVVLGRIYFY